MFDNTLKFINNIELLLVSENPDFTEREIVKLYEIEIAKNLIIDLGNNSARRIGKILIAATEV